MKTKVKVRGLSKSFEGRVVLDELDLDVLEKESLVILGKSGTGKSVLIRNISTLMVPDRGSVEIDGEEVTALRESKRFLLMDRFGFLFQNGALFDSMNVWENIAFKLLFGRRMPRREARMVALEKLAIVNLDERVAELYPSELSGGMQKRVALARAIACDPEIIFFDEPTTGLDPVTANKINHLILRTIELTGATAITITHDIHSAELIATRIVLLDEGKIRWEGDRHSLRESASPLMDNFINGTE
ncbi:MAG: ATP-binding cassette domain-containing protein [Rickettsiales bacterium]|jgi:phospholipid/cholesterol/gamma-HCH transport system ATP-binding protein|nr:ATP-binding cassette domain-containing protein [Rickettsiales bacterium]